MPTHCVGRIYIVARRWHGESYLATCVHAILPGGCHNSKRNEHIGSRYFGLPGVVMYSSSFFLYCRELISIQGRKWRLQGCLFIKRVSPLAAMYCPVACFSVAFGVLGECNS